MSPLAAAALLVLASPVYSPAERATAWTTRGHELYAEADYGGAAIAFDAAHELEPNATRLEWAMRAHARAGDHDTAREKHAAIRDRADALAEELGVAPSPAPRRRNGLQVAFFTSLGPTVASGLTLATLGGLTRRERRRFDDAKCEIACPVSAAYPDDEARRFRQYRLATNVFIGVTAALAVTTTALAIAWAKKGRPRWAWGPSGAAVSF